MARTEDGLTPSQKMLVVQESDSAKHLLAYGLRTLREAAFTSTTLDPVLTMLSIGTEKLLKVTLGLIHVADSGGWLSKQVMKNEYGHDIVKMEKQVRSYIRENIDNATYPHLVRQLLDELEADTLWPLLVATLDRYGREGRFYYLDALADNPQRSDSPAGMWTQVELAAMDADADLYSLFLQSTKAFHMTDEVNLRLNAAVADSLDRWWRLMALAGVQGVFGDRNQGWGADLRIIGRQIIGQE